MYLKLRYIDPAPPCSFRNLKARAAEEDDKDARWPFWLKGSRIASCF